MTASRGIPTYNGPVNGHSYDYLCCPEKLRLRSELLDAICELNAVLWQQTHALAGGDPDFSRFDLLLHSAQQRKDGAKYALLAHVQAHGCQEAPDSVPEQSR